MCKAEKRAALANKRIQGLAGRVRARNTNLPLSITRILFKAETLTTNKATERLEEV